MQIWAYIGYRQILGTHVLVYTGAKNSDEVRFPKPVNTSMYFNIGPNLEYDYKDRRRHAA